LETVRRVRPQEVSRFRANHQGKRIKISLTHIAAFTPYLSDNQFLTFGRVQSGALRIFFLQRVLIPFHPTYRQYRTVARVTHYIPVTLHQTIVKMYIFFVCGSIFDCVLKNMLQRYTYSADNQQTPVHDEALLKNTSTDYQNLTKIASEIILLLS